MCRISISTEDKKKLNCISRNNKNIYKKMCVKLLFIKDQIWEKLTRQFRIDFILKTTGFTGNAIKCDFLNDLCALESTVQITRKINFPQKTMN